MSFSIYEASAPVLAHALTSMQAWLDKAVAEGKDEKALMEARLAPDMYPLSKQIQIASDTAKGAIARLTGIEAPSMADTEASFAELKARCQKTIDFITSVDRAKFDGAETRQVYLRFPGGVGYQFIGKDYLTGFALPNFFFHVTTTYALLRAAGVGVGKPDFLAHLGQPVALQASLTRRVEDGSLGAKPRGGTLVKHFRTGGPGRWLPLFISAAAAQACLKPEPGPGRLRPAPAAALRRLRRLLTFEGVTTARWCRSRAGGGGCASATRPECRTAPLAIGAAHIDLTAPGAGDPARQ